MKHFSIRKFLLASALALGLGSFTSAYAEAPDGFLEISPYSEQFESATTNLSTPTTGWDRYKKSGSMSYTTNNSGKTGKCIGTSSSLPATTYDFVVTPRVKGDVKFCIKKYNVSTYYTPVVQVYKLTKTDGGFEVDTEAEPFYTVSEEDWATLTTTSGDAAWKQIKLPQLEDYEYLGFRIGYAFIDDFEASSALIPIVKSIEIDKVDPSTQTINANADDTVTINVTVTVTNKGNVAIGTAIDDNIKLTLAKRLNGSVPYVYEEAFATADIPTIQPGQSVDIKLGGNYPIPADATPNSSGEIGLGNNFFALVDAFPTAFRTLGYIWVKPNKGIMNLKYFKNTSKQASDYLALPDSVIYFGAAQGSVAKSFRISNSGPAPLVVNNFEAPEWVSVTGLDFPATIAPGENQDVTVTIGGNPGYKKGNVKFLCEGLAIRDNADISADIAPEGVYFENFESADAFSKWYVPNGSDQWTVAEYTDTERNSNNNAGTGYYYPEFNINNSRLQNGRNNDPGHDIYSPLMKFENGDKISFYAAKRTNSGNDVQLTVSYSSDRSNWTELGKIKVTNSDNTDLQFAQGSASSTTGGGQNVYKRFEFEMPEGNYYICLNAGYVLIDNFVGGELIDVPYDIVSESAKAGGVKMVNNNVSFTANFKNIHSVDVAAEGQVVTLYANGKAVATTNAEAIEAGKAVDYDFVYVPHEAGETTLQAEIALGDFKVTSPSVTIDIAEEAALVPNVIGTYTSNTVTTYPFTFNWTHSGGESIYTAEELQGLASNEIVKLSLMYKKPNAHGASAVKIWMENTEDETFETAVLHEWTDEDLVFSNDDYVVGASDDFIELPFIFNKPFVYTGKNLRIGYQLICNTDGSSANTGVATFQTADERNNVTYLKWNKDNVKDLATMTPTKTTGRQTVIILSTEKEVPTVAGTVKDESGNAIAGAAVKAQSGDVIYQAVAGEEGAWEMTIFQPELDYTLTVTAEGYEPFEGSLNKEASNDVVLQPAAPAYNQFEGLVEVENWSEPFSSNPVSSSKFVAPEGWNKVNDGDGMTYTSTSHGTGSSIGTAKSQIAEGSETFDLLVTPPVKGTLTFDVKRYAYASSYVFDVKFYKLTKNEDGTFTIGQEIPYTSPFEAGSTDNAWKTDQSINVGDDYTYVGIRLSEGYLDEFKAPNALMPIRKSISIGTIAHKEGYSTSVKANEDNMITIGITVPITNNGNVPLVAEEEGETYAVSMARAISTSSPYTVEIMKTQALPDLAIGETVTVEFEETLQVPEGITPNSYGEIRFRVDVVEQFTNEEIVSGANSKSGFWYDVIPYTSILRIMYDQKSNYNGSVTDTQVDPAKTIGYGTFVGERELSFRLVNRGAAPLTFESIDKPEWVTITNLPESIAPGADPVTIGVKIGGEPGVKTGSIKFNTNGSPLVDEISLMGEVVPNDVFFADFEGEDGAAAWFAPNAGAKWELASYTDSERSATENYYYVEYGYNDKRLQHTARIEPVDDLYSPKLAFEAGDSISFYAAKRTNSGSDVILTVSYSPDRANWTELGTISVTNTENPDLQFSSGTSSSTTSAGQNIMKRFSFEMPEGEYYINLGGSYVLVDNFYGGKLVDVDYDIASLGQEAGKTRMVNNPLTFTASFRNLVDKTIEAADQTVTLYADGEAVATAQPVDIEGLSNVTYEFSYVPHMAGESVLHAEIAIDHYVASSSEVAVTIQNESASVENQIGEIATSNTNVPLRLGDNNSKSEFIYTAADLAELKGNKIVKVVYPYYKTSDDRTADVVNIWMQNTADTEVGDAFTDVNTMTKVMSTENYQFVKAGASGNYVEMEFVLDEGFVYDGTNLRVVVEAKTPQYGSTSFGMDASKNRKARYYSNDNRGTYENYNGAGTLLQNIGMPVVYLYTELELTPATGTVKTSEGDAVEGALVTATADNADVFYTATTDAEGKWSMTIFRNDLTYTVSATAEDLGSSEPVALDMTASNDLVIEVEPKEEIVKAPRLIDYQQEENLEDDTYTLTIFWTLDDEEEIEPFAETDAPAYTFRVEHNENVHGFTQEYQYTIEGLGMGEHVVKIFTVSPTTKESEPLVITLNLLTPSGVNGIGADDADVRYFDLNGIEIHADDLEHGIYIRVQGKNVEKILINK